MLSGWCLTLLDRPGATDAKVIAHLDETTRGGLQDFAVDEKAAYLVVGGIPNNGGGHRTVLTRVPFDGSKAAVLLDSVLGDGPTLSGLAVDAAAIYVLATVKDDQGRKRVQITQHLKDGHGFTTLSDDPAGDRDVLLNMDAKSLVFLHDASVVRLAKPAR